MASQGQDLADRLDFSYRGDGNIQLTDTSKAEKPGFLTPKKDTQMIAVNPAIPSWLMNSINRKRNLQPVSTPVKDIVTRYAARGSKAKKIKTDANFIKDPVTGKVTAEVATYKKKKESGDINSEGLKVSSIDLGTITRDTGNNFFKFSADHMLTQSEKDSREKKELKGMITTMATYIDSLINVGASPITQVPQSFDPNSAESQQLMKQVQRGKLLTNAMINWVDNIIKEGNKFISEFTDVYAEGEIFLKEIQTLLLVWETELGLCQAVVFQVTEVERFGVLKFLNENPMKSVDPCMLFILKNNMTWKETLYKEAIKEMQIIENKIAEMHEDLIKDMKVVNSTGILEFDERNMDAEVLIKNFNEATEQIKNSESPKADDFTVLASIESMLRLNKDLMLRQNLKVKEYKWKKDTCRARISSLKILIQLPRRNFYPHFRVGSWYARPLEKRIKLPMLETKSSPFGRLCCSNHFFV
jgi:hypothetical protein